MLTRYKYISEEIKSGNKIVILSHDIDRFLLELSHYVSCEVVEKKGNKYSIKKQTH